MAYRGATVHAAVIVLSGLLLTGCDKLKAFDELQSNAGKTNLQVADLESQSAKYRQELSELRSEIAGLRVRVLVLEANSSKQQADQPSSRQRLAEDDIAKLNVVIAKCVAVARNLPPKDEYAASFYKDFDAFYNVGTGRVQDNVIYNGGQPARFAFNKCMADRGWPLG
ncbi:hypothetical protein [Variovorax soli]|uniref:Outer membrane murein-binding lipoprotein Lpp n=1 Tax=Variovorax soli TaxID=376815 RepID=A0ABU1NKB0_9BURK|nr:hypothetical protein [Variovorax soli]MDR6538866.1 outer membrane murein-binding lipoprotein Lpp [Variovorax soli]